MFLPQALELYSVFPDMVPRCWAWWNSSINIHFSLPELTERRARQTTQIEREKYIDIPSLLPINQIVENVCYVSSQGGFAILTCGLRQTYTPHHRHCWETMDMEKNPPDNCSPLRGRKTLYLILIITEGQIDNVEIATIWVEATVLHKTW